MKIKNILKLLLIIYTANNVQCSFFQPTTRISQPTLARKHNALFDTTVSYSVANQAFNTDHKKVSLLQQFGSEDFLKRFIDPTLSQTNTSSWGNILLNAKARNLQYDFCCSYNITDNFFLGLHLCAIDFKVHEITASYIDKNPTQDQQQALEKLMLRLQPISNYGLYESSFFAGYTTCLQDFTHLNFIDISISGSCNIPQAVHDTHTNLLHLPNLYNSQTSASITGASAVGILDWLVFGAYVSPTFCFNRQHNLAYNKAFSNNTLLKDNHLSATVFAGPAITTGLYIKAEHMFPGFTCMFGYTYTHSPRYTLTNTPIQINDDILTQLIKNTDYTVGTLYTEIELDFAQEKDPYLPKFSLRCSIPLHGKHALRAKNVSANYCLQFNKTF